MPLSQKHHQQVRGQITEQYLQLKQKRTSMQNHEELNQNLIKEQKNKVFNKRGNDCLIDI